MLRLKDLSLSLLLPLVAAASVLVAGLCLVWLAARSSDYLQNEREQRYGDALARQVAAAVREPLRRGDLLSLRVSLEQFVENSLAQAVTVRDLEGSALGVAGLAADTADYAYRAPVRIGRDTAGEVLLAVGDPQLSESRWRFLFSLIALASALAVLVFLLTRILAGRITAALLALDSQLNLSPADTATSTDNELGRLTRTVQQLPLDMLRGQAPIPSAALEFSDRIILFVHLASLVRYVRTLSESNLHRYTRRLQQLIGAAAQCYRGNVTVTRPFGLLITFSDQDSAGSEALRAVSCAQLIAQIATGLEERTTLSLELAMALGQCEQSADNAEDIYPALHLQGIVDELRDGCLQQEEYPVVLLSDALLDDAQLRAAAQLRELADGSGRTLHELERLVPERQELINHQAQLIVERIKPQRSTAPARS